MKVYEYVFKLTDRFSPQMQRFKRLAGQGQGNLNRLQRAAGGFGASAYRAFSKAERGLSRLQRQTRSTGSAFSDLRAQVAGFVSVYAGISLARDSLNVAANLQAVGNAINFASGSAGEARTNMNFLNQVINSLGMDAMSAYNGFKILMGSFKDTALQGGAARAIFQSVATASTAMGLSADQAQGALVAIGQIMSKGKVQAEELRGQLGERIPGAFQIAARAMNMTTAELDKFMSDGKLTAEQFLPAFAKELHATFVDGAATASTGLRAAMNRAGNTMLQIKDLIGTQLAPVIVHLSEKLFQAAHWLKENWSTVMAVGKAFLWAGGIFATFKVTTALLTGGVTLLTGAMRLGRMAVLLFTGQFQALNVVMKANPIGLVATAITALIGVFTWAYNKFDWFKGGIWGIWEAFKEVFSSIGDLAKGVLGGIVNTLAGIFTGNFAQAKAGFKMLGGSLSQFGGNVSSAFSRGYQEGVQDFNRQPDGPKVPNMPEFNMPKLPGLDYPGLQPFMPNGTDAVSQVANSLGGADSASSGGRRSGIEAITGGGKQVTNISIHSPKLAERIEIEFATVEEGMNDLEGKMQEVLARALNNFTRNQQ